MVSFTTKKPKLFVSAANAGRFPMEKKNKADLAVKLARMEVEGGQVEPTPLIHIQESISHASRTNGEH